MSSSSETASQIFRRAAGITDEWDSEPPEVKDEAWFDEKFAIIDRFLNPPTPYPQNAEGKPIPPPPKKKQKPLKKKIPKAPKKKRGKR